MRDLVPKLATTLKGYTRPQLASDLLAGTIVGIVALPLAIAFAIASGVTPQAGLVTAIIAGFLISALGGSRVQIGGPTGAFVVIIYGIVQEYGVDGLRVATTLAGLMLIAMGVARMGVVIKFIPQPLITGFTSGIAVIIALGQVKDAFGLRMGAVPAEFLEKLKAYAENAGSVNLSAAGITAFALVILLAWPRVSRRIPAPLVALIVTTVLVRLLDLQVETIGSRFGELKFNVPLPQPPAITFSEATRLVSPAFAIALLGAIESLLSAVVADGMIGTRHRSNMELVAQGVANVASATFGGIPATGAIARTATNIKNGARTPIAGMWHAVVLLLIALLFSRWASMIPMATLAAILFLVAYHMSEWRNFVDELRAPRGDVAVLLVSFFLTVVVDLTVAIEVGMVLAAFLFMYRMAETTAVNPMRRAMQEEASGEEHDLVRTEIPSGVEVFEISGAFFFGAAERFKDTLSQVATRPKVLVIRMRDVSLLDATALRALRDVVRRSRAERMLVLIAEVHAQPLLTLQRSALWSELGSEAVFLTLEDALDHARTWMATRTPTPLATPVTGPR
ncbi:MAG: STAS domain-containing protein [Gemmatimonadetes bacterium]|nr:STAS domain-containing protein [Gemmatimonadota bacterium]